MKPLILAGVVFLSELQQVPSPAAVVQNIPTNVSPKEAVPGLRVAPPARGDDSIEVLADAPTCLSGLDVDALKPSWPLFSPERVVPLRLERLLEENGAASLRVEYVVVDRRTRGAKSLRTETIALKPVATYVAGGPRHAYAYRDERFVHIVWPTTVHCSHAHMRVDVTEPNGPKSSSVARSQAFVSPPKALDVRVSASLSMSTQDPEPLLSVGVAVR